MEEEKEDAFEASAFDALEKDFQEVLQELVGDKSLEHFRLEYEKLHRALKKSHDSEKKLIKKCRELNTEIVTNAVKVQNALKLSQEDQATIGSLKKEIERAWKMVEASHEKEQRAKETIHSLKVEIASLSKLVEQGAGKSINQENAVNQLVQAKNDLLKHRDMLQGQVAQLTNQNQALSSKVDSMLAEKEQEGGELTGLKDQLVQRKTELERELRKKEKLDQELKESRAALDESAEEIRRKSQEIHQKQDALHAVHGQLREQHKERDRLDGKMALMSDDVVTLQKQYNDEVALKKKFAKEAEETKMAIKMLDDDLKSVIQSKEKIQRMTEKLQKDKGAKDLERAMLEQSRNELKAEVQGLQKRVEKLSRQEEADAKMVQDMLHERDILNKNAVKADDRTKDSADLVKRHEAQVNNLTREVQRWKSALGETEKRVYELERQNEKYSAELSLASGRYIHTLEELKARDNKHTELKSAVGDVKGKLAQQKTMYEAVRTDRNLYSKNWLESNDEIAEMKRKFKSMTHQIENLKEEIKEKDQLLIKEHFEKNKVKKSSEAINDNLKKANTRMGRLQQLTEQQKTEVKKLESAIAEAEQEQQNQRKEFDQVTSERNILGTQLIRRNDELSLLYEKIKIQKSTLDKGETQYKERLDEIRILKQQVLKLRRNVHVMNEEAGSLSELDKEVYHLERELLHEKAKVKALSEELENPMNVHRWRKLEGSDPATYELLQKVTTLQSRLIHKSEEVMAKDALMVDKEKAYLTLKTVLARQPGPEIAEQVVLYRENLQQKGRQMKAMTTEVKTYQSQVNEYKDEVARVNRELQQVKRKFFEQKKREQVAREAQRPEVKIKIQPNLMQPRYAGGGFCLSNPYVH